MPTGQKSIEWAAGLFEGEGCLTYIESRNSWQMKVKMTDGDAMWKFFEAIGLVGTLYGMTKSPSMEEHHKPVMVWKIERRDAIKEVVDLLLPHMCKRRAEKMNDFLTWYDNTRN